MNAYVTHIHNLTNGNYLSTSFPSEWGIHWHIDIIRFIWNGILIHKKTIIPCLWNLFWFWFIPLPYTQLIILVLNNQTDTILSILVEMSIGKVWYVVAIECELQTLNILFMIYIGRLFKLYSQYCFWHASSV